MDTLRITMYLSTFFLYIMYFCVGAMPEWSKGVDLSSTVLSTHGFEPHSHHANTLSSDSMKFRATDLCTKIERFLVVKKVDVMSVSDVEDLVSSTAVSDKVYDDIKSFMREVSVLDWNNFSSKFRRRFKYQITKQMVRYVYTNESGGRVPRELIKKAGRSQYGILNVCVFTAANPEYTDTDGNRKVQQFSCKHNCYYCPSEPGQPRSYLMKEPGVARANECDFDCVKQFYMRLSQYQRMGHLLDKIEFEVSGGTWSEYPREYQREFIRDGYFAANTFGKPIRDKMSLEDEIRINETSSIHIIGLTIETRPDTIDLNELRMFREFNVTRVQIGVQHTDNRILKKINRGHTIEQTKFAIKLLLDNSFKVDVHLMPMLPGSTPDTDKAMFNDMLYDTELQVDQWKVYPCSVVPWSVLEKWYHSGRFKPYSNQELYEVLSYMKHRIHRRIRLNRIVRDINDEYILGGCSVSHMRQLLQKEFANICQCIRCRSVKDDIIYPGYKIKVDTFEASGAKECFISVVSRNEQRLYGFCRLRLPKSQCVQMDILKDCALVRELHVYATMTPVNYVHADGASVQHKGLGKSLMHKAEHIALLNGYRKIAVISGVGVRNYYRKLGYELRETYMMKNISMTSLYKNICVRICITMSLISLMYVAILLVVDNR